ncbi:MAG: bifunctional metallophosphatase/5'-nucleotidase [Bacillota bacterium]|jgi:5'-nucleotidase/UDP-sugar diphosphatase
MRHRRAIAILLTLLLLIAAFAPGPLPSAAALTAEQELFFTIMHTNDEHSALYPAPLADYHPQGSNASSGGFARLAQAVQDVRQQLGDEPSLLLSAGDYLTGSPFSWLALQGQAPELDLMLQLGYDVITLGNHEFDYGPDVLANYLKAASYPSAAAQTPIVASNIVIPEGHPLGEAGILPTYLKTLPNGLTIGFFGLLGVEASEVSPAAAPVTFSDQQTAAQAAVQELEAAGADLIVALSHCGEDEEPEIARAVSGIDIIIGGHTHTEMEQPLEVNGTLIVQTGTKLANLGLLRAAYDPATGQVRLRNAELGQPYLIPLNEGIPFNQEFTAKVDAYAAQLGDLLADMTNNRFHSIHQPIVRADFTVSNKPELAESPFGNYVADAMRIIGSEVTGDHVDFALQANGVIRGSMQPGQEAEPVGQVALLDLINLVGLGVGPDMRPGYPLVSFYFTGEEMRRVLEVGALLSELKGDIYFLQYSGLRMQYDPDRAILATVPIKNLPIPTGRAVLAAERYTGPGVQTSQPDGDYLPLERGDQQLYHVVSDYYLAAFLPMVGEMLPSWALVMKDKDGNPLASVDDAIVYRDGQEMKVWQAVLEYSASLPVGASGLPEVPAYYQTVSGRQIKADTLPIWLWPAAGVLVVIVVLVWGIRTWRKRRHSVPA